MLKNINIYTKCANNLKYKNVILMLEGVLIRYLRGVKLKCKNGLLIIYDL